MSITDKDPNDKDKLFNWIISQPNLTFIRKKANETPIAYNAQEVDPSQRIKILKEPEYFKKKSIFEKLSNFIWVKGKQLRGNAYSDEDHDSNLNQTATFLSLSTAWDFICTYPVVYYFAKASGALVLPVSSLYALILLGISNATGKYAMNRGKENNRTASFLLIVFFSLSLVKTLMSGVGIDLVQRSGEIKNVTAKEYLNANNIINQDKKPAYSELLLSAENECNRLAKQLDKIDITKGGQRRLYRDLQQKMFKKPDNPIDSDPKSLIDNYLTDLGSCNQKDLIKSFIDKNDLELNKPIVIKNNLRNTLSPMAYLYLFNRNQYYNIFKGNPLSGSEVNYENYKKTFEKTNINFTTNCLENDFECKGSVRWTNPGMAINEASKQFYGKVINKEFASLGFAFVGFIISVLLSLTAVVMLYSASINPKLIASRSNYLKALRNEIFTKIKSKK